MNTDREIERRAYELCVALEILNTRLDSASRVICDFIRKGEGVSFGMGYATAIRDLLEDTEDYTNEYEGNHNYPSMARRFLALKVLLTRGDRLTVCLDKGFTISSETRNKMMKQRVAYLPCCHIPEDRIHEMMPAREGTDGV